MTIIVLYYEYARRQKLMVVIIQLFIVALIGFSYVIKNIDDINLLRNMIDRFSGYGTSDVKSDSRLSIWAVGFEIAANQFFCGTGIGSMVREYAELGKHEIHYAHNYYLELLIEEGLVICLSFFKMRNHIRNKRVRLLALHIIICSIFIFVIDDYYTVRSGAWLYVASAVSMQKWFLIRKSLS